MKRVLYKSKGVSPVIAVILMVAITIVLAGVVFIWAQSFTNQVEDNPTYTNIKVSLSTNEESPPIQQLAIEILQGKIKWSGYTVKVDEILLTTSNDEDNAGDIEIFTVPDSSNDGLDFSIGSSYHVKIISRDFNRIVFDDEIICTRAL